MSFSSRQKDKTRCFPVIFWMLLTAALCPAQSVELINKTSPAAGTPAASAATATLNGIVTDENDAVIPGASVSVKDLSRKLQKSAMTGSDGSFMITELLPGSYIVAVQREGFSTAEVTDVMLRMGEQTALKIQLRVGHIGETVTITAEPSPLKKSMASGMTLERNTIEDLPLNGRSLQPLLLLAPGAVPTHATFSEQGQLSVNGQRANTNYFMVDGVSANIGVAAGASGTGQSGAGSLPGLSAMGTTNTLVQLEALQEMKILTSAFAPEFGRMPGAQVLLTTRGGTNQFHGSVFEYFRSDAFGARDWFAPAGAASLPSSRTHNYGGAVGGPIFKDRTHFFFSYEGLSARLPQFATREVPTLLARQQAPVRLQPFFNVFPLPNGAAQINPVTGLPTGFAEFSAGYTDSASFNAASLRLDQRIGDRLTLFARYNFAPSEIVQRGAGSSLSDSLRMSFETQTVTIGATYLITPRLVNDFRANYSRSLGEKFFEQDDFGGAIPLDDARIFPAFASHENSFYSFTLGGNKSIFIGKDASSFQDQFNFVDNLAYTFGSHQLKFGFDYRRLSAVYDEWKYRENTVFNSLAELQSGSASFVAISAQDRTAIKFTNFSVYAQDSWRASRRLSLTYGLRWEYNPAPTGEYAQSLFTVQGLEDPASLTLAPAGTPLYQASYNNFAPRVGVAFQLFERQGLETLLRGGFGVFYDTGTGTLGNSASSFPYQRRKNYAQIPYPLNGLYTTPIPYTHTLPVGLIRVADPRLQLPRVMQWNFGIEQSLGAKQVLSATYVGAAGRRLLRTELLLNPNPDFEQVFVTTNKASADYHALQLHFQRRLSHGFQAIASYTWSHSIDIASNDSTANLPALAGYDARLDRASSDFDVRHSLTAAVTYDVPALFKTGMGNTLLRGWSLDTLFSARTAAPVDIFSRRNSEFGTFNLRPDLVAGAPLYLSDPQAPGGRRINPAAFAVPLADRQGTLGRNALRGFPFTQIDLSLHRRFALTERVGLQFRMEVFNLLNHPNFGDPVNDLSSDGFGRSNAMLGRSLSAINNTGFNPLFQAGGPRAVQFAFKLQF